jgi:hypothetical protein
MTESFQRWGLARIAQLVFGLSVLISVAGVAITVAQAPCSRDGPYFLVPSLVLAAVGAIVFFVHALLIRSWAEAWRSFEVPMLVALGVWSFSFVANVMLCRGL